MWPLRRPEEPKPRKALRRLVAGLIIGGAIGSIVGRKIIDKAREEHGPEGDEEEHEED